MIEAWELDIGPHRFSYTELKQATRGFRDKELLGLVGLVEFIKGHCQIQTPKSQLIEFLMRRPKKIII